MSLEPEAARAGLGRGGAIAGLLAGLLNVFAVAALQSTPHCYKPGQLELWLDELHARPGDSAAAGWLFTVGVLLLIPFAQALERRCARAGGGWGMLGARLIAAGALMNAAATLAPFVVAWYLPQSPEMRPVSLALLGLSLAMDALFNLIFGLGVLLCGLSLSATEGWVWTGRLGFTAGLATIPVGLQAVSVGFANWLLVAGPLWLLWIFTASAKLWAWGRPPSPYD